MRFVAWLLPYLALACLLAATPIDAWAQTSTGPSISGIEGAVLRCECPGNGCLPTNTGACTNADNAAPPTGNEHPSGVVDSVINFEDCEANLYYQFELGISYPSSSYQLEAWVGTEDCSQLTNRQTEALSVCWPVAPFVQSLVNPFLLNVRVQDIVSGAFTTQHPVTYTPTTDDTVCQAQTQTGATGLVLYMFFADLEGNPIGTVQQYPITIDMRSGNVQGNISVGVGDTVLIVNIPPTTDPDTQGYNVYCDPPPGQESASETVPIDAPSNNGKCAAQVPDTGVVSATDALSGIEDSGVDDSAGAGVAMFDDAGGNICGASLNDAGIPSPGGCSASSVLVFGGGSDIIATTNEAGETIYEEGGSDIVVEEGGVPATGTMVLGFQYNEPYTAKYLCGYGGATSTTINVTGANGNPLKDYSYYNIAVACVDGNGNVGPLSNVPCGEPVPVADFWYQYYEAGGRAGGLCSTDGVGLPAGTTGLGVLMGAAMVATVRRRRRG